MRRRLRCSRWTGARRRRSSTGSRTPSGTRSYARYGEPQNKIYGSTCSAITEGRRGGKGKITFFNIYFSDAYGEVPTAIKIKGVGLRP